MGVTALWTEGYTGQGAGGRSTPYELWEFDAPVEAGRMLVAEEGGDLLGVIVLHPPGAPGAEHAAAGEAELSRLVVAERARRRGLGRELARRCMDLAAAQGASGVVLWSRPYQRPAHRLYESLGWRRAPERDGRDRDGERLVFVLRLDG